MDEKTYRGIVSFVHHEKKFATIEYKSGGKTKSVNCKTDMAQEGGKKHYFRPGDEVTFKLKLSDRGDRQTAHEVRFLYNSGLDSLLQRARHENRFTGYLKESEGDLFVKESETYLYFPLQLSPFENRPGTQSFNAPVTFQLTNLDKPRRLGASLFFRVFKPEYRQAQQDQAAKKRLPATVSRVSPHAVYLELYEGKLTAKLPQAGSEAVKPGDVIDVLITFLGEDRVVVAPAQ